ncbi:hypothetical protein [Catenulispora pinisilvae]|uniref:hypothetical protein n=1 Tax=Catenulispora pinisilvae TaxID=2705253 RepID=UPI0018912981|nr:hypothetical protein [Catenulispora pinisilvae]
MTDDLATALRTMADSDQPPVMDVERVLHEGRHTLARQRMATLGGGTAVLAVTALAVGALAGMGSGVRGGTEAASATFTVNPHDPVVTHWQFAYIPPGMVAYGAFNPADEQESTVLQSADPRFQLELIPMEAPILIDGNPRGGGATEKVPVKVPGTAEAYWEGYGNGRITASNGEGGEMAALQIQLKSGEWHEINANNIEARPDWQAQTLKAAGSLVHQDRSVPMPLQVAGALPQSFTFLGGEAMRKNGATSADLMYRLGPDQPHEDIVSISASMVGGQKNAVQPGDTAICKDSKGLRICVIAPSPEPAALTAIGGAQGLLDRVTSLGDDPANWTTDVIR